MITKKLYSKALGTRQYYTGDAIKIDCKVHAYNPFETKIYAWSRFKHSLTGRHTIEWDHPVGGNGVVPQRIGGEYGRYSHSDTLAHYNVDLDGIQAYDSGAYVRLVVTGGGGEDHYFISNFERFDSNDKPYDAP